MTKVKVIGAYVNEHGPGSIIEVDDKTANYLERIGYGKIQVETEKAKEAPKAAQPKAKQKAKPKKEKGEK